MISKIRTNKMGGSVREFVFYFFTLFYFCFSVLYFCPFSLLTSYFPPFPPSFFFSLIWFLPLCYFSIFLHDSVSVTLHVVVSPPLPSFPTKAAAEISRNPLPPISHPSLVISLRIYLIYGSHRNSPWPLNNADERVMQTRPYCSHLYSLCLWIKRLHSLGER